MCGIVGFVCKSAHGFAKKQEDTLWQLLKVGEVRGEDSTGLVYVENDGGFGILKEANSASWCSYDMYKHKMLSQSLRFGKAYIGHNRKATVGKVKDDTAHPFVVDETFAMVHNGTLFNHGKLKQTEVDSEALAHHLKPILTGNLSDDALNEEMGKIDGAYAVSAYSQEKNEVYLVRNSQRPLNMVETPDGIAWASEGLMLAWVLDRNGYDLSKCNGRTIKEHTIVTIDLATNKITEREYSPKKAITGTTVPHTQITGNLKGGVSTKTITRFPSKLLTPRISKNLFKKLRAKHIGNRHSFTVADYVEKNFPKTIEDGETLVNLIGDFDGDWIGDVTHSLSALVDLATVNGLDDMTDLIDTNWSGKIVDMLFDRGTGNVTFVLEDIKLTPKSVATNVVSIIETTRKKWNAVAPSPLDIEDILKKAPTDLTDEEWKKLNISHYWSSTEQAWKKKDETTPTLH
jgi:hypothetical protein